MRNIVICCDGTGNEISENISNVLKLYRCLRKTDKTTPHQVVFYDPGVGTLARPDPWQKLKQDFVAILGLATGYGLDDKVLQSYLFLVRNYQDGDQIYLFGFSRGAYTVRVLAGLIHKVGLISPEQDNLAGMGLITYKQYSSDNPNAGVGDARCVAALRARPHTHHHADDLAATEIALDHDELRERMSGNLCRCGAHNGIVAAITRTYASQASATGTAQ